MREQDQRPGVACVDEGLELCVGPACRQGVQRREGGGGMGRRELRG
jgi:hypothetical protein